MDNGETKRRNKPIKYGYDLHIRLPKETYDKIKKISDVSGKVMAQILRELIDLGLGEKICYNDTKNVEIKQKRQMEEYHYGKIKKSNQQSRETEIQERQEV